MEAHWGLLALRSVESFGQAAGGPPAAPEPEFLMPRLATTSSDLQDVLALAEQNTYVEWPSHPGSRKETALAFLRGMPQADYDLWVTDSLTGFLVLQKQVTRAITADRESVIQDFFAPDASEQKMLLECADDAARSYGSQYLTTEIAPQEEQRGQLLRSLDYKLESHTISVATANNPMPKGSPYSTRLAGPGDDFAIAVLNATMLPHTVSAGRETDVGEASFRSMDAIFAQVNRQDDHSVALVLTKDHQVVGHLLLELTEHRGYVYDLALTREHWGGKAAPHIMLAGSKLLWERGIPWLVGDVSAANLRAVRYAQRFLGFSIDCERYARRL